MSGENMSSAILRNQTLAVEFQTATAEQIYFTNTPPILYQYSTSSFSSSSSYASSSTFSSLFQQLFITIISLLIADETTRYVG
jgi:hypothetical protein